MGVALVLLVVLIGAPLAIGARCFYVDNRAGKP